jgi:hypothetical protein
VEVELGVTWEGVGTRWSSKAPNGSVPETSAPNPYLQNIDGSRVILQGLSVTNLRNIDGSCVILQGLSVTNLSGSHCLSLQVGEGCVETAAILTVVC